MRKEHVAGKPAFSSVPWAMGFACLTALSCTPAHHDLDAGPATCAAPAFFAGAVSLGAFTAFAEWNLGDVNGDGRDDIAIANLVDQSAEDTECPLTVALGADDGGFAPQALGFAPGCFVNTEYPLKAWADDTNGDGRPDLIILAASSFDVWYGSADGSFGDAGGFSLDEFLIGGLLGGALVQDGVTGDFNGDGSHEVALDAMVDGGGSPHEQLLVFTRGSAPLYGYPLRLELDACTHLANTLASADFNGDGVEDIARVDCEGNLQLFPGGGLLNPAFSPTVFPNRGAASIGMLATGSLFGDAGVDVVVGLADHLELYAGREDGGFVDRGALGSGIPPSGYRYGSISIADWDGDGLVDVAASVVGGDGEAASFDFFLRAADGGFDGPASTNCPSGVSLLGVRGSRTSLPDLIVQPYLQFDQPRLFVR